MNAPYVPAMLSDQDLADVVDYADVLCSSDKSSEEEKQNQWNQLPDLCADFAM